MTQPMTDLDKLAPCPLHGGEARLSEQMLDERMGYNTLYTIAVQCCSLTMTGSTKEGKGGWADDPKLEGRAALIKCWNTRP